MGARVHFSGWQNPCFQQRRRRLRRHRFVNRGLPRFLVVAIWILGSPNTRSDQGTVGVWSTQFVAAQSAGASSSYSQDYSASCDGIQQPRPGAIYSAVGHLNYGVGLDLKADISIPGECEVNLPIDVSRVLRCLLSLKFDMAIYCDTCQKIMSTQALHSTTSSNANHQRYLPILSRR